MQSESDASRMKKATRLGCFILRRVDKKDATRLIAVSSDIVQIWL